MKTVILTLPEVKYVFMASLKKGSEDVLLNFRSHNETAELFLTDKTGVLRAAAINDPTGVRLITNEQATKKFRAVMRVFAGVAADLPPTETAPPGKNEVPSTSK